MEEQKIEDIVIDLKCARCHSKAIYTTRKTRVCRHCGHIEILNNGTK